MARGYRSKVVLFLMLGVLLAFGAAPATAVAGEFPICTRSGNQTDPAISGSRIVYTDESPGSNHYQVYVYDIATKTEQAVSPATWTQDWAAIDGTIVAYVYYESGKLPWQAYHRDLNGGAASPISSNTDNQMNVCVDNGVFVWTGGNQIYRKGPSDIAPVALTSAAKSYESEDSLALDGGRVVFACRNGATGATHDLGVVPVSGGAITWLRVDATKTLDASSPDISGDRVVWQDNRNGDYDIYLYDLARNRETRITTAAGDQTDPAISGDTIVWTDHPTAAANGYVTTYDITTGVTRRIDATGHAYDPDIDGSVVVWWDTRVPGTGGGDYNIYGYDLSSPDTFTKWTKRTSGTTSSLLAVDFVSSKVGWVVGFDGTILKTTNAGVSWVKQDSGTTVELSGVDFVNTTTGWAVGYDRPGDRAVVLKTTDGGAHWTPQSHPSPASAWANDVLAVDAMTAFGFAGGVTPPQGLFCTGDGGTTWTSHPDAVAANMFGVSRLFLPGTAWAVGYPNAVIKTTDGGATWVPVAHGGSGTELLTGAAVVDASTALVVGQTAPANIDPNANGIIWRTSDGGATWTSPAPPAGDQLRAVEALGANSWAVGEGGALYHSGDAGVTWKRQATPSITTGLWDVRAQSVDLVCAVGVNGTILTGLRPTATLSRPAAPTSVKRGAYFKITGTVKPRHTGSTPLTFYRKAGTKWVKYRTVKAKNANYSTFTKYTLRYKLGTAGKWYVVASHSCTDHRASTSAKEYFTVK